MGLKKHGITSETIKNMILGAGVIYKNLKYEKPSNGWTGTPLGATSGGLKFNYEAQWLDVEVDGATVLIKGVSKQKVGESATLEGQMTELTEDILVSALHLVKSTSEDTTYVKYVSKENITEADYLENVAYVGTLSSGKNVIIILPNALCTEAFMDMIRVAVNEENASLLEKLDRILTILESYMPFIPQLANLKLVTDTGVLAGELAPAMDEELGKIFDKEGRR